MTSKKIIIMLDSNNEDTKIKNDVEDSDQSYWNKWYLVVLLFLIAQIIIFHVITVTFK